MQCFFSGISEALDFPKPGLKPSIRVMIVMMLTSNATIWYDVYVRNCTQCYGKTQQPMCLLKKKNLFRDEKVSHWFPSFDTGLLIVYPQSSIINYQLPITLLVNFHVHHLHHDQNDPGHDGRMLCSEKLLWALWSGLHAHHWLETLVFSDEDHNHKMIKISDTRD